MTASYVILFDFDGTLTESETMDLIYNRFAACGLKYSRQWSQGKISTIQEITSTFATITASREELETLFEKTTLIPGAVEFLQRCIDEDRHIAVVSDGLRWYIDSILSRAGFPGIRIYANGIYFEPDGFKFSFTWYDPDTPMRSSSKAGIIRRYQRRGSFVTFIGNGKSDTGAVGVADRLCARDWLADYCEERAVEFVRFNNFYDLMEKFQQH
ncbi:MAG: HAD-IB family phosphatase [Anaerolineales bacterium]|nr:HAD-IB family phosphatase [Anaerolineales bacterium]